MGRSSTPLRYRAPRYFARDIPSFKPAARLGIPRGAEGDYAPTKYSSGSSISHLNETTYLAGRNVSWVQLVTASDVNVEQLLLAKSVILVGDALTTLANRTA